MKIYTRELVMSRMLDLATEIQQYSDGAPIDSVLQRMKSTQDEFGRLRHAVHGLLTSTITQIEAIHAQARDEQRQKISVMRKQQRQASLEALLEMNEGLRQHLEQMDGEMEVYREKLAQALAALSAVGSMPIRESVHREWTNQIWEALITHQTTKGMGVYLKAKLARPDRDSLMDELLGHLGEQ